MSQVKMVITGFVSKPVCKECPFGEKNSMSLTADGHCNFYVESATEFITVSICVVGPEEVAE